MRKSIIALAVFCSVFSAFAQKTFTVSEFKSYVQNYKIASGAEGETVSIKIKDVLSSETQNNLVTLTWKTENSQNLYFDLDLSECTYADDDCILELFHIKNVRRCVLPTSTKRLRYFDCMQLEEITLPDGLEEINYNAFFDVPLLKRIEIPASVRYVGACAFGDYGGGDARPALSDGAVCAPNAWRLYLWTSAATDNRGVGQWQMSG